MSLLAASVSTMMKRNKFICFELSFIGMDGEVGKCSDNKLVDGSFMNSLTTLHEKLFLMK